MRPPRLLLATFLGFSLLLVGSATVTAQGAVNWLFPTANVVGTAPNCGATAISGQTFDANGAPLNGVQIRVRASTGGFSVLSAPSANGGSWGVSIGSGAVAGTWQAYVEASGQEVSPMVVINTQGPAQCAPGSGGVQKAFVNFSRVAAAPLPTPQNPVNPGLLFPYTSVTGTEPNCGATALNGQLQNANGGPVSGYAVRVINTAGGFSQLSGLSDGNGNWNLTMANSAVATTWQAWVEINGVQASNTVNVRTTGPDQCAPGSGGIQTVQLLFKEAGAGPVGPFNPPPAPGTNQLYTGAITLAQPNCGTTNISGRVVSAAGAGLDGVVVRIQSDDGSYQTQMATVDNGNWAFNLGPRAIAGLWHLWVDDGGGNHLSPAVNIQTTGPNQCAPGSGGIQTVEVTYTRVN